MGQVILEIFRRLVCFLILVYSSLFIINNFQVLNFASFEISEGKKVLLMLEVYA